MSDAARWVREATRYGVSCGVVEGHRPAGRNSSFEDSVTKTRLRLTGNSLKTESGTTLLQLQELKSVETHLVRPSSPVFRIARDDVVSRLVTLRWNQTGRQVTTSQKLHLLFPTTADARTFQDNMTEVQRFGVKGVLAGQCGKDPPTAEPAQWQIERVRERFLRSRRSPASRRSLTAQEQDILPQPPEPPEECPEADGLTLSEDCEMHERWAEALAGRRAPELPMEELRPLVDGGMPLKYRHALWPLWLTDLDAGDVGELEARVDEDAARQVALDIPRTNPGWLNEHTRSKLRRVLRAYAARNPDTGYCQGMNFLVMVFVLLGFSEAVAFAGLCHLVEVVCPGYHGPGLEGYMRDAAVLEVLAHHLLPQAHQQLEELEVPLSILALDHFIALAARTWPFAAVVRLWDLVLLEGTSAVFASFLASLELYLPAAIEAARQGPHGSGPDGRPSPADVMDEFKQASKRGAARELEVVLARTRQWIPLVPLMLILRLRTEIDADGDR